MPRTLNPSVAGSSPARPTSVIKGLGPLRTEYRPADDEDGDDTLPGILGQALVFLEHCAGAEVPDGANDKPGTEQPGAGPAT